MKKATDPDKINSRLECIRALDLHIVGLAETHLADNNELGIQGYSWFSNSKTAKHKNAKRWSGGVGFLISDEITEDYNVSILNQTEEGILWLRFDKKDNSIYFCVCVCYLPPEGSSSQVNAQKFYDTLLGQYYKYKDIGVYFICGDFNSRMGTLNDIIEGEDEIEPRNITDYHKNRYGELLQEFLLSAELCMLNGRSGADGFTSVSEKGFSVIDYALVEIEKFSIHTNFQVHDPFRIFEVAGCVGRFNVNISDHAILTWDSNIRFHKKEKQEVKSSKKVYDYTKIPTNFMDDNNTAKTLRNCIKQLEVKEATQKSIDKINNEFCHVIYREMQEKLKSRNITLPKSCKKQGKAWWNDELSSIWKDMRRAEKQWKIAIRNKEQKKETFCKLRKELDRKIQKAKRKHKRKSKPNY